MANIEDAISSPVDLPSTIKRYQDVLRYAGSEVNFVYGFGLYMAPGNMLLQVGQVEGYNNKIVVATAAQKLGENTDINILPTPPPTITGETSIITNLKDQAEDTHPPASVTRHSVSTQERTDSASATTGEPARFENTIKGFHPGTNSTSHENEKTALVVGAVGIGLLAIWVFT
jgi:hypothetical protein